MTTCIGCRFYEILYVADDGSALGQCCWEPEGGFPPSFYYALRERRSMWGNEEHIC